MDAIAADLNEFGFVCVRSVFSTPESAFETSGALIRASAAAKGLPRLAVLGDFVLPPLDGEPTREFQTLHFDFGLPLDPKLDQDVARYTALHIPSDVGTVSAVTRLVPLARLMRQRSWAPLAELRGALIDYGRTHGAWDDAFGYLEGSLAHGRRGARQPGELRQRVWGHPHLSPAAQRELRDQVLTAFEMPSTPAS